MDHLCPRQTFASAPCLSCLSQPQTTKRPTKLLFRNYSYPVPPQSARFYSTTSELAPAPEFRPTLQKSKSLEVVPTTQLAVKATVVKPSSITTVRATSPLPRANTPPSTTLPRNIPVKLPQVDEDKPVVARSLPETQIKSLLHSINVPAAAYNESRRDSATLPCFNQPISSDNHFTFSYDKIK